MGQLKKDRIKEETSAPWFAVNRDEIKLYVVWWILSLLHLSLPAVTCCLCQIAWTLLAQGDEASWEGGALMLLQMSLHFTNFVTHRTVHLLYSNSFLTNRNSNTTQNVPSLTLTEAVPLPWTMYPSPNKADVLPGYADLNQAVTRPCWPHLYAVLPSYLIQTIPFLIHWPVMLCT
jgi:hypothetical protein